MEKGYANTSTGISPFLFLANGIHLPNGSSAGNSTGLYQTGRPCPQTTPAQIKKKKCALSNESKNY